MLRKALPITILVLALLVPAAPAGSGAQSSIALPAEFRPEGIASGKGDSFYVGSIPLGAVYRGSYRTGEGSVLVPPHPGRNHTGLKVDTRFDRLFVAGGASKGIYVYDSKTGEDVASFELPDAGFVNDVVLTRNAAYFTDSLVEQLYRVDIRGNGELTRPQRVKYRGDLVFTDGFNVNGIDTLEGGNRLVVVKSNSGELFRVNGRSGFTRKIDLDQTVTNGDGILRQDDTLYVVRNQLNEVAVVKLDDHARSGEVRRALTDSRLDIPTTIAPFKDFIYAVNARFGRPDDDEDDIVRLQDSRHR
ncbi:MAG: superoxide dismutase [Thermoleophilaceae bacterium]